MQLESEATVTYCSECGQPLATPSAKFCSACGSAVPSATATTSPPEAVATTAAPGSLPPVSPRVQPRDPSRALPAGPPPATSRRRGRFVWLCLLVIIGLIAAFMLGARSNDDEGASTNPSTGETAAVEPGAESTPGTATGEASGPASQPSPASSVPGGTNGPVMPSVVGMVLQDAQDLLQSQGSYLMDQIDATGGGRYQFFDSNWKVCSQEPSAGAPLASSDVVKLNTVKLDESCP